MNEFMIAITGTVNQHRVGSTRTVLRTGLIALSFSTVESCLRISGKLSSATMYRLILPFQCYKNARN